MLFGYRTIPYEEGTESLMMMEVSQGSLGYRTIPYEEGTERRLLLHRFLINPKIQNHSL